MLPALIAAAVLAYLIALQARRYCRHCKGLGKTLRRGKPRDCRRCHGTGKAPHKRRAEARATRDPIHRTGDPIAAYRRNTTAPKQGANQ